MNDEELFPPFTKLDDLESAWATEQEAKYGHDNCIYNSCIYNSNGVRFILVVFDSKYMIFTNKYKIDWYMDGDIYIYNVFDDFPVPESYFQLIIATKKEFDMSLFAILKDDNDSPYELQLIWSSFDVVNSQIEKIMKLEPVKKIPQLGVFI